MKKPIHHNITTLGLSILAAATLNAQPGLIGCFPLDGHANDESGNNNHGTAYNLAQAADRFGNPNRAFHFSGTNSGILPDDSLYRLNTYTYSVWFRLDSIPATGNYYCILSVGGNNSDQAILIDNDPNFSNVCVGAGSWDSLLNPHSCYSGNLPALNQWYHVVVTRDNDYVKMFVDNSHICIAVTNAAAGYIGPLHNTSIGARHDTTDQNFVGVIDEVKIFDYVLTPAELAVLDTSCFSATGINELAVDMSLQCHFDPVSNQIVIDYGGRNNDIQRLSIYALPGCLSFSARGPVASINASAFSKGMHVVRATYKSGGEGFSKVIVY